VLSEGGNIEGQERRMNKPKDKILPFNQYNAVIVHCLKMQTNKVVNIVLSEFSRY
jgi:hypothetical protein